MKNPKTYLGYLGLQVEFHFPQRKTIYRTITYPYSFRYKKQGTRECLNLTTNKAEKIACNKEVEISKHSEVSENK